jgi:hypothetical protein
MRASMHTETGGSADRPGRLTTPPDLCAANPAMRAPVHTEAGSSADRPGRLTTPPDLCAASPAMRASMHTEAGGVRWRRIASVGALVSGAALTGGCAERRLLSSPASAPGAGAWAAVWLAAALAVVVVGVLLARPAWEQRTGGRFAVTLLTVQAGASVVGGGVLTAMAVRSWQLIDVEAGTPPSTSLLRLSGIDGDTSFFALMVLLTAAMTALVALVLALGARMAATDDTAERWVASAILGLEVALAGAAVASLFLGFDGLPITIAAFHLPVVAYAFATCMPRESPAPSADAASPLAPSPA